MPKTSSRTKPVSSKNPPSVLNNPPSTYTSYTDGSFRPPNCGAYAVLILKDGEEHAILSKSVWDCTINQMELMAIAEALSFFTQRSQITIVSDSQYAVLCCTRWVHAWIRNSWLNASGEPVKNRALIEKIHHLCKTHDVSFRWIRGHAGNVYNERCDKIAQAITKDMVAQKLLPPIT